MRRTIKLIGKVPMPLLGLVVLAGALGVGISSIMQWWSAAVLLLLVCQFTTAGVIIRAIGTLSTAARPETPSSVRSDGPLLELETKLDLLSGRTVSALERTRTELLSAVRDASAAHQHASDPDHR